MKDTKVLRELKPGQKGKIAKVLAANPVNRRILEMGITKGAEVEVVRVAPFGDPVEIRIKGYLLSLRKDEASNIFVEVD